MRYLTLFAAAAALLAQDHSPQVQDRNSNRNQDRTRGQSHPPDQSQSWTRGRLGTQGPVAGKLADISGMLIDASCDDRTALNLGRPPEPATTPAAPPSDTGRSADRAAAAGTPPEVAAQQTPDSFSRQSDRSCAVTGGTRGFAILTTEGRLLNLDEGGNTMIVQGLHSNPAGRAMLNGTGPAIKPHVSLRGRVHGDRLIVEKIVKL